MAAKEWHANLVGQIIVILRLMGGGNEGGGGVSGGGEGILRQGESGQWEMLWGDLLCCPDPLGRGK